MNDIHGTILIIVGALQVSTPVASAQPSFEGLGQLQPSFPDSRAEAVSADGTTVVGSAQVALGFSHAFRWTRESGMQSLGTLPNPWAPSENDLRSAAYGVSANGQVVVGSSGNFEWAPPYVQSFRWMEETGMVRLGAGCCDGAFGVSADGSVIAGLRGTYGGRWTAETGWIALGRIPGTDRDAVGAAAVSADGNTMVGHAHSVGDNTDEAFIWRLGEGIAGLGDLSGGEFRSYAYAVSPDGSTVVGLSYSGDGRQAFRWTEGTGIMGLGFLVGGEFRSIANATSADGTVVVGNSVSVVDPNFSPAFIWDVAHAIRPLVEFFAEQGLDLDGWTTVSVSDITPDGRTFVGSGRNPAGQVEAWLASLGPPCPADFNNDDSLNSQDFFDFLACFFAPGGPCPPLAADFNSDGAINSQDFFDFLAAFFAGCP